MEKTFLLLILVLAGIMIAAIVQSLMSSSTGKDGGLVKFIKWRNEIQGVKTEITPTTIRWTRLSLILTVIGLIAMVGVVVFQFV